MYNNDGYKKLNMEYGNFIIVYLKAWVTHHSLVMVQWVYQVFSMCHLSVSSASL